MSTEISAKSNEAYDQTHVSDSTILGSPGLTDLFRRFFFSCCGPKQERKVRPNEAKKKLLVLDLDETLIHASSEEIYPADLVMNVTLDMTECTYYVYKRPFLDEFLRALDQFFEISIFTASMQAYADRIIDFIDPQGIVTERKFRDSCTLNKGNYIKDLRIFNRQLNDIVILDNTPASFSFQPNNGITIRSWAGNTQDSELRRLLPFLEAIATVESIPSMIVHLKRRKLKAK